MTKPEKTVEGYIAERNAPVQALLVRLRALVLATLDEPKEVMKWGAPVYVNSYGKEVIYLYGGKDHANLGFVHGADLSDPKRLLKGTGKSGRHVKVFPDKDFAQISLVALIGQCEDQS